MSNDVKDDYEQTWENKWAKYCVNEDGGINLDQIKRELHDYAFVLDQVPSVYMEVTGGQLSKTNYYASGVITAYEDNVNEIFKYNIIDIIQQIMASKIGNESYDEAIDDIIDYLKDDYHIKDTDINQSIS